MIDAVIVGRWLSTAVTGSARRKVGLAVAGDLRAVGDAAEYQHMVSGHKTALCLEQAQRRIGRPAPDRTDAGNGRNAIGCDAHRAAARARAASTSGTLVAEADSIGERGT